MSSPLDTARPVREGEELDIEKLEEFLRTNIPGADGALVVEQFPKGYSNLTYLLRCGAKELVLRRPPFGSKVKSAHDMSREYKVLSRLADAYELAPRPLAFCEDPDVLGCDFYVMERRSGIILRQQLPAGLEIPPETMRRLCDNLVDNLALLHSIDYEACGLGDLGKPEGYVRRQVDGWSKRYRNAKTSEVEAAEGIMVWLDENEPGEQVRPSLIHNDYKFDNVVLDPEDHTRLIAVLDWEMATVGDPLMDLGTSLAYWVEASDEDALKFFVPGPTWLPGALTRHEVVDRYFRQRKIEPVDPLFYYCFGLFKLAVIVQQIYYRYAQGLTKDQRFAVLDQVAAKLCEAAVSASQRGAI